MSNRSRQTAHSKYQKRITSLIKVYNSSESSSPEDQSHQAKYLAVLISGYLEQAIKELLLEYASKGSNPKIAKYIREAWPNSLNMSTDKIDTLLGRFDDSWQRSFKDWITIDERKNHINSIISWRNKIAHGDEKNTTGVTLVSVKNALSIVTSLVSFLEELIYK